MTAPPAPAKPSPIPTLAAFAAAAAAVFAGIALWRAGNHLAELQTAEHANAAVLQQVLGEVTRMRLEQSAGTKGPQALLEKLRTYAPLLASSRTAEPEFASAKKEMDAILRAFGTLGTDAWRPIQERLAQLKPEKDFDEISHLLRAGLAADHAAGVLQLKEVVLGHVLPSPRLRWYAARILTDADRPLAQNVLRQVLLTESSKGFNAAHAEMYPGAVIPDQAAMSETGFHNYVIAYARTEDSKLDDTLLMVMGRNEHDRATMQECVKLLGSRRCARAVPAIEKLYREPPLRQEDPIFLTYCLEALVDIQGEAAKPFLEAALPKAATEIVSKKIQFLLNKIATGDLAHKPPTLPVEKK